MDPNISIPSIGGQQTNEYQNNVYSKIKFERPCRIHYHPNVFIDENQILKFKNNQYMGDFTLFCENLLNTLAEYTEQFPCQGVIEWEGEDTVDYGYYEMKRNGEWNCHFKKRYNQYPSPWEEFED